MASEGEIAAAEAAVREAEANLQSLLGRSINNGVMLESRGPRVGIEAAAGRGDGGEAAAARVAQQLKTAGRVEALASRPETAPNSGLLGL